MGPRLMVASLTLASSEETLTSSLKKMGSLHTASLEAAAAPFKVQTVVPCFRR